jgi:hypothetical protein
MNRRKFLSSSAAASLCLGAFGVCAVSPREAPVSPRWVLFDSRFAQCRNFGSAAAATGQPTIAFHGDVTHVWRSRLLPYWDARGRSGGEAVAGYTTSSGLFCLEQLAKDHWLRVVLRVEASSRESSVQQRVASGARPTWAHTADALFGTVDMGKGPGHENLVAWIIAA